MMRASLNMKMKSLTKMTNHQKPRKKKMRLLESFLTRKMKKKINLMIKKNTNHNFH